VLEKDRSMSARRWVCGVADAARTGDGARIKSCGWKEAAGLRYRRGVKLENNRFIIFFL